MAVAYLGLGTNLGDRRGNLSAALTKLQRCARIQAVSTVYRTEPVGYRNQPDFWNLVVSVATELEPAALLACILEVERALGRERTFRNAPRTIDIDLLLYDERVIDEPGLSVPHPRMLERAFVLAPLAELRPDLRHPVTGYTVKEALARVGLRGVTPLFPGADLLIDRGED